MKRLLKTLGLFKLQEYIFKNMGIKKRVMLFFLLIIIIPLTAICLISYIRFSDYAWRFTLKSRTDLMNSDLREIIANKDAYERLMGQIVMNSYIQDAVSPKQVFPGKYEKLVYDEQIISLLKSYLYANISCISVIGNEGQNYVGHASAISIEDISEFQNFIKDNFAGQNSDGKMWIVSKEDIFNIISQKNDKYFIYVVSRIYDLDNSTLSQLGWAVIQLSYSNFHSILSSSSLSDGEFSVLVSNNGMTVCSAGKDDITGQKVESRTAEMLETGKGFFTKELDMEKFIILFTRDTDTEWSIIRYIPYKFILEESKWISKFILVIMLVCLIPAIILALLFSRSITSPIVSLNKAMEQFGKDNLAMSIVNDRKDEIGKLQISFSAMLGEIRDLIEKMKQEYKERRRLEMNILEYQINPHFLYNTFDSINWMAVRSGNSDIAELVMSLANFFRTGLSKGKEFITLREELEHAYNYLVINRINYNNCFYFKFNVDETVNEFMTIKLILQPVIENWIKHGMDKARNDGFAEITAKQEDSCIILQVSDNGSGIKPGILDKIKCRLINCTEAPSYDGGVGLVNVCQRIRMYYGDGYGLDIESTYGRGTSVTLRIPKVK